MEAVCYTIWYVPRDDPSEETKYIFYSGDEITYHAGRLIAQNLMLEDWVRDAWVEEDED